MSALTAAPTIEVLEYSRKSLRDILTNWGEVEDSENETMVIIRCDLELAVQCLPRAHRTIVRTFFVLNPTDVLESGAVSADEYSLVVEELLEVLNVTGIGGAMQ